MIRCGEIVGNDLSKAVEKNIEGVQVTLTGLAELVEKLTKWKKLMFFLILP